MFCVFFEELEFLLLIRDSIHVLSIFLIDSDVRLFLNLVLETFPPAIRKQFVIFDRV